MQPQRADWLRQSDIISPKDLPWTVNVIGLGGIGGIAMEALWALGFRSFVLWDDDVVASHNLPNQLPYLPSDIGRYKVDVAKERLVARGVDPDQITVRGRFTESSTLDGIAVSGVDSMASRQTIWNVVSALRPRTTVPLYLDGRLGGEKYQLFVVRLTRPSDLQHYEGWLFPSSKASRLPCTAQSIANTTLALAAEINNVITRWVRHEPFPLSVMVEMDSFQRILGPMSDSR